MLLWTTCGQAKHGPDMKQLRPPTLDKFNKVIQGCMLAENAFWNPHFCRRRFISLTSRFPVSSDSSVTTRMMPRNLVTSAVARAALVQQRPGALPRRKGGGTATSWWYHQFCVQHSHFPLSPPLPLPPHLRGKRAGRLRTGRRCLGRGKRRHFRIRSVLPQCYLPARPPVSRTSGRARLGRAEAGERLTTACSGLLSTRGLRSSRNRNCR